MMHFVMIFAWVQADVEIPGGYPKAAPVWSLKVVHKGSSKQLTAAVAAMPDADPAAVSAAVAARQRGEETNTQLKSIEAELNCYASSQAAAHGCPGITYCPCVHIYRSALCV